MIDPKVPLDLGGGRMLRFTVAHFGGPAIGAIEEHPDLRDPSKLCSGSLMFDTPESHALYDTGQYGRATFWTVEQEDPLTLSPSVLCTQCGNHGWVREGKWTNA